MPSYGWGRKITTLKCRQSKGNKSAITDNPLKLRVHKLTMAIFTQLKVTSKSHTLNKGQYLVHSERRTADNSTFNFMA